MTLISLDNPAYQSEAAVVAPPVSYIPSSGGVVIGNPNEVEALSKVKEFVAKCFTGAALVEERSVSLLLVSSYC